MWPFKRRKQPVEPVTAQERLQDGELPWGWFSRNKHICSPYEDKIVNMAVTLKNYSGTDRIQLLEELVEYYYEFKDFCYQKDECFRKYFQDMWEHCHNSRNADFEYIVPFEEELNKLKTGE